MNSMVAPSNPVDFFASAIRCFGVPFVPDSPPEHTTKCTWRLARVSAATTPPNPNSMSSGCAPKGSSGGGLGEFRVSFIGSVNDISLDESNFRIFFRTKIILLAGASDVMAIPYDRLHPAEPSIAGWTDLLLSERRQGQRQK